MIEYESLKAVNNKYKDEFVDAFKIFLDSGWYVLGTGVKEFENQFASYVGSKYCAGVGNGLDALTLSLLALNLPKGSRILVAANTYIATILAVLHSGLIPVLVDADPVSCNIDTTKIEASVDSNTRGLLITHLYGNPCDMDAVLHLVNKYDLFLLEDCAQSHGATYKGKQCGTFGHFGCYSFYPTKNIGALGDAGAVVTNDFDLFNKVSALRNYGSREKYINEYVGFNSRLDELQAILLSIKLKDYPRVLPHKKRLAEIYFNNLPKQLALPERHPLKDQVFHIFHIRHQERDSIRQFLLDNGVKTEIHYPLPPSEQLCMRPFSLGDFHIASEIHKTILSLPISYATTENEVLQVCNLLNIYFLNAK